MNMRLLGARTIDELTPEMVDASALHSHVGLTPPDNLYNTTCGFIPFHREIFLLIMHVVRKINPWRLPSSRASYETHDIGVHYLSFAHTVPSLFNSYLVALFRYTAHDI